MKTYQRNSITLFAIIFVFLFLALTILQAQLHIAPSLEYRLFNLGLFVPANFQAKDISYHRVRFDKLSTGKKITEASLEIYYFPENFHDIGPSDLLAYVKKLWPELIELPKVKGRAHVRQRVKLQSASALFLKKLSAKLGRKKGKTFLSKGSGISRNLTHNLDPSISGKNPEFLIFDLLPSGQRSSRVEILHFRHGKKRYFLQSSFLLHRKGFLQMPVHEFFSSVRILYQAHDQKNMKLLLENLLASLHKDRTRFLQRNNEKIKAEKGLTHSKPNNDIITPAIKGKDYFLEPFFYQGRVMESREWYLKTIKRKEKERAIDKDSLLAHTSGWFFLDQEDLSAEQHRQIARDEFLRLKDHLSPFREKFSSGDVVVYHGGKNWYFFILRKRGEQWFIYAYSENLPSHKGPNPDSSIKIYW